MAFFSINRKIVGGCNFFLHLKYLYVILRKREKDSFIQRKQRKEFENETFTLHAFGGCYDAVYRCM